MHTCTCASSLVYERKLFFFQSNGNCYLKKQPPSDKSNHIFCEYVKNKGNIVVDILLGFADVSS